MINRIRETLEAQNTLARQVIRLAMKVHRSLGYGFEETVYHNALALELNRAGLVFDYLPTLPIIYEGAEVGAFQTDMIVENRLIVGLKAVDVLPESLAVQLTNYLVVSKMEEGLLLNFGAKNLEFKTKTHVTHPGPKRLKPPNSKA